jgi:hypothetical protein
VSLLKDAISAMKQVLLLEERIASQSKKTEQLVDRMVEMERRLAMMEGRMEGFIAGAAVFTAGATHSPARNQSSLKLIGKKSGRSGLPDPDNKTIE